MNKATGAIVGAAAGLLLFGTAGYSLGYLYLAWFGPENCCGLEGLYPLIVGVVTGTALGVTIGALAGIVAVKRRPLKLTKLAILLAGGIALAWLLSVVTGEWTVEQVGPILVFLSLTLFLPTIVWVTDVWEKPEADRDHTDG
jgi:hypothetical protein